MGNKQRNTNYDKKKLKKIENLEKELVNCKKQLDDATKENCELKEYIKSLENENHQLKESVNNKSRINDTKHTVKSAGRKPKSEEEIQKQQQKIKSLLSDGMKEKEICTQMNISRSTYYRLKGHKKCHQ